MDNQHRKITGYRELSQVEVDMMNKIKRHGEQLRLLVEELHTVQDHDPRWLEEGKMQLQLGIMSLVRSVAKPSSF